MSNYPDSFGYAELDRRSRMESSFTFGDAIGSMITSTVFGLVRAADEVRAERRHGGPRPAANDEVILEASGWR